MSFTVISYYTQDWLYPQYARELQEACDRFGLQHHIVERPSTGGYVGNCQIKPFFIQECMAEISGPIMWIDADASLLARPTLLLESRCDSYDMIGNHPLDAPHRVHVGSIRINPTARSREFVDAWCSEIIRKRPVDDAAFNGTWDSMKNRMDFLALPPEYFYIQRHLNGQPPPNTVIMHRLSRSELKALYKKATEHK